MQVRGLKSPEEDELLALMAIPQLLPVALGSTVCVGFGSACQRVESSGRGERWHVARLMHRPVRVRGGPSVRATYGERCRPGCRAG
jgi:hypothetical protein